MLAVECGEASEPACDALRSAMGTHVGCLTGEYLDVVRAFVDTMHIAFDVDPPKLLLQDLSQTEHILPGRQLTCRPSQVLTTIRCVILSS